MLQLIWWAHVFLGSGIATFFAWDYEPAAFGDISYWVLTVPNGDVIGPVCSSRTIIFQD